MPYLPASDTDFQITPYAEAGNDGFRLRIPMSTIKPGTAVPAGTTYADAVLPQKPKPNEGWELYVAGRRVVAEDDALYQHFVRALPSTPNIAEADYHPIFGRTFVHSYDDLISNDRPDRGDTVAVTTGALEGWDGSASTGYLTAWDGSAGGAALQMNDVRVVLDCAEVDQGQGLCEVKVTTVENAQVTILDDEGVDEESGIVDTVAKTHTLTSTRPASAATDSEGYYTLVTRQDHNWWLSTRRLASTLPNNEANAITESKVERTDVYWPDVLAAHRFLAVLDSSTLEYWHKKLFYTIKAAYTGDVRVEYSRWFQMTEPTLPDPVEMVATPINTPREWSDDISIDRCLHPLFEVGEPIIGGSVPYSGDIAYKQATYSVPATPYEDWPDEVVKMNVKRVRGGYECTRMRIFKPSSAIAGTNIVFSDYADTIYYYSNYDTGGGG